MPEVFAGHSRTPSTFLKVKRLHLASQVGCWRQHRWLINGTQLVEGDELRSHNPRQFTFSYLPPISTLVHSWICYFQGRFTAQWPQELGPFSYTSSYDNSLLTRWHSSGISNPHSTKMKLHGGWGREEEMPWWPTQSTAERQQICWFLLPKDQTFVI